MVIAEGGQRGIVQSLGADTVEILMLDTAGLVNNLAIARTDEQFQIPVGVGLLGRVVNAFAESVDGAGPVAGDKTPCPIEPPAPGIDVRVKVTRPLEAGVTIVDLLVPIGYGQRELVIGDKKTGKTTFLLQTISSQAAKGVICVYVSIGKRQNDVKTIEGYLRKKGVFDKCVVVAATAADPSTMVYLAPFTGLAIAEFFRDAGSDVLIIFDDLTNHAKFYREISLLLRRAPGRSSYPGDIFHLHAALLERAGNVKIPSGQTVAITALPVAETLEGDITGYIQTNLMAITDGHIFFDIDEFRKGARPAINPALSVSRVGNQTKTSLDRELASIVRENLTAYKKALEIARFGVELPEKTQAEIALGEKIEVIFNQDSETVIPRPFQLTLLGLLLAGFWSGKTANLVKIDVIKLAQKYQKEFSKDFEGQFADIKSVDELIGVMKKITAKIMDNLYV
jgi:F-type H+-transporting ATPase subunit alpha